MVLEKGVRELCFFFIFFTTRWKREVIYNLWCVFFFIVYSQFAFRLKKRVFIWSSSDLIFLFFLLCYTRVFMKGAFFFFGEKMSYGKNHIFVFYFWTSVAEVEMEVNLNLIFFSWKILSGVNCKIFHSQDEKISKLTIFYFNFAIKIIPR